MNRLLTKLFKKQDLELGFNLWKTDKCYKCGGSYDKNSFWTEFTEINDTIFSVPICDKCSGESIKEAPSLH